MRWVINTMGTRICVNDTDDGICMGLIKINANRMYCVKCGTHTDFTNGYIPAENGEVVHSAVQERGEKYWLH